MNAPTTRPPLPRPAEDPARVSPAVPLLSSYEMYLKLMAAPWASQPPARLSPTSRR